MILDLNKEKFFQLLETETETNSLDFKRDLYLSSKSQKYNLVKDFLAFANFGGGYILIGVEDHSCQIVPFNEKIDASKIGNAIEGALGFNIQFELRYYKKDEGYIGLIYIYPSDRILTCPRNLNCEQNRLVIGENDILTRRNTKSIKANADDLQSIHQRIQNSYNEEISSEKPSLFENETQMVGSLWNFINNEIHITAEWFSLNFRRVLLCSQHNKLDYAKLVGLSPARFEELLMGEALPELHEIIRVSNFSNIDPKLFFESNFRGERPFWDLALIKFIITKRITNVNTLVKVSNEKEFYGRIIYLLAKNMVVFKNWIKDNHINELLLRTGNGIGVSKIIDSYSDSKITELNGQMGLQYYKLLELSYQVENCSNPYTEQEFLIVTWMSTSQTLLARVITEAIKNVEIDDELNPIVNFYFWDELRKGKVRRRKYDNINYELIFIDELK